VKRVLDTLDRHMNKYPDPQMTWKWLRATSTASMIAASCSNRHHDPVMSRTYFNIRIGDDGIIVGTKDGQNIECHKHSNQLENALRLQAIQQQLSNLAQQARFASWQLLHANINAVDDECQPAPTLYACNTTATRSIFVQFHMEGNPTIRVRKNGNDSEKEEEDFVLLNYEQLEGSTFCRKLDNLLSLLRC